MTMSADSCGYTENIYRQMVYSRNKLERIVIGTMLNESGKDGFFNGSRIVLRKELFKDKRNVFLFAVLERMYKDGLRRSTPYDVFKYANEKSIPYGNAENFCTYMCEVSENYYVFIGFKKYVKQLVDLYVKENRHARQK